MSSHKTCHCQYYAYSQLDLRRVLYSWRVENKSDAEGCLKRMGQTIGYYVERHRPSGKVLRNEKIYSRK